MSKRKKKPGKTSSRAAAADAPLPPFRSFERAFAGFGDGPPSDAPLNRAQDLIYQAWEIPNPAKRIAMAKQALETCADCADAYLLLGEEQSHSLEEALDLYQQAVAAGERALGPQTFEDAVGHFWGLHETRPYMRARQQLSLLLWEFGDRSAAIAHARDLLRLNPNDNQGIRSVLIGWLLSTGNVSDAQALWAQYNEDASADWSWSRALIAYIEHGDSDAARTCIDEAVAGNPHVPALLLGRTTLPAEQPEYVGLGDPAEAVAYVQANLSVWQCSDGALRWLSRCVPPAPARRRT